jgi:hypothetical protein
MIMAKIWQEMGSGGSKVVVMKKIGPKNGRTVANAGRNSAGPKNFAIQTKGQSSQ